jgi:hypothetical protein
MRRWRWRGNKEDPLALAGEAASTLKLKNGDDDGIIVDCSLLEDVVTGIGAREMDGNSPDVGMSNNDDNNDVHSHHLSGPSFWVQMLKSNIIMLLLFDPLNMSMAQRNFASHYYRTGVWCTPMWDKNS